jgi:hypothetical protein
MKVTEQAGLGLKAKTKQRPSNKARRFLTLALRDSPQQSKELSLLHC